MLQPEQKVLIQNFITLAAQPPVIAIFLLHNHQFFCDYCRVVQFGHSEEKSQIHRENGGANLYTAVVGIQ